MFLSGSSRDADRIRSPSINQYLPGVAHSNDFGPRDEVFGDGWEEVNDRFKTQPILSLWDIDTGNVFVDNDTL